METYKKSLSKMKLSKNYKKNTDPKQQSVRENLDFGKLNGLNLNPLKIISAAWRKSEILENQMRKTMY